MDSKGTLKIHPEDNVMVALRDLPAGTPVMVDGHIIELADDIPMKHKFVTHSMAVNDEILMYGVLVGKATTAIPAGGRISRSNIRHAAREFTLETTRKQWLPPDVGKFRERTFLGFHRNGGQVGTRNYWLVIPLVFCENRNIEVIREAMLEKLGYLTASNFVVNTDRLIDLYQRGADRTELLQADIIMDAKAAKAARVFPNVDGIKFLSHDGGCGGMRQDSTTLCRLLAGYIANPNVAGATILSLGCQNAEYETLQAALQEIDPGSDKPVILLEQQQSESERAYIAEAVKRTFIGLIDANRIERSPAPLSKLCLGLECGGSDGFSGITANPALGYASDLLVALGGTTILSEFPELNGVEQELINRCATPEIAGKFARLMSEYETRAQALGSDFSMNPSPGNIKDGLITDAIKSAGAAKKGGTSPVTGVLDYTEPAKQPGLNLLCTPGNDVESTTGLAGSGSNIIVFTTGLGTPTGNPVAPTIKLASNTVLARKMADIIDIDAGSIITGEDTIESKGEELLELIIQVASGHISPKAVKLGQDDFIPWKRGISL